MPFRKLPNTDIQRLEALRSASDKANNTPLTELAFNETNFNILKTFYPDFKKEMDERGNALSVQSESTTARIEVEDNCRMFTSHFYQVFNLGVARGKYKVSDRAYYQLDVNQETVPDLKTEQNLRTWTENIINGEPKRTAAGGAEMVNPSIAEVEAVYNTYVIKLTEQSTKKDAYEKEQKDVDNLRAEADELIRDIWDEIEFKFRKDDSSAMRRKAREYGVVYVSRPGEPVDEIKPEEKPIEQPTT
ncbi:MAG: hypothetical protein NTX22_18040 [Ignavibacteriales bacterium]|nr:hypothetical protein [Ignavibacteriales bacterium]